MIQNDPIVRRQADRDTVLGWGCTRVPKHAPRAKRKLEAINAASRLDDLRVPPSNRLEKLKGDLSGFHSIRINDQWRIIFKWLKGEPHAVQIVDYH
jgi:toxin HigB-1